MGVSRRNDWHGKQHFAAVKSDGDTWCWWLHC
jgi:hypothetical protein